MERMKGSCLCCGIPLDRATRFVAVIDVVMGAVIFGSWIIYVYNVCSMGEARDKDEFCKDVERYFPQQKSNEYRSRDRRPLAHWVPILCLASAGIQCIMGMVLYAAANSKNRRMCQLWMFAAFITCIFTGFLLRIYQMLVVSEFSHELLNLQRLSRGGNCRVPPSSVSAAVSSSSTVTSTTTTEYVSHHNNNFGGNVTAGYPPYQQYHMPPPYLVTPAPTSPPSAPFLSRPSTMEEQPPPPYHIAIRCPPAHLN